MAPRTSRGHFFTRFSRPTKRKRGLSNNLMVYILYVISCAVIFLSGYVSIRCSKETASRAIPILEGQDSLDGRSQYPNRVSPIAVAAMRAGYHMFAVQHGGQCFSSASAPLTYNK